MVKKVVTDVKKIPHFGGVAVWLVRAFVLGIFLSGISVCEEV